jgi:hypothetical protein
MIHTYKFYYYIQALSQRSFNSIGDTVSTAMTVDCKHGVKVHITTLYEAKKSLHNKVHSLIVSVPDVFQPSPSDLKDTITVIVLKISGT